MISSFDIDKMTSLLKDFYTVTHIRIAVFDENFHELTSYPKYQARFCLLIRQNPKTYELCKACDRKACQDAGMRHDAYIYECHAGLREAVMPIRLSNIIIGYLMFGHVFGYPSFEEGWAVIKEKCSKYDLDMNELLAACRELSLTDDDHIKAAANMMHAIASYLCMERMVTLHNEDLPVKIDNYIHEHISEDISAQSICRQFGIGKTKLYRIAASSYGMGISALIRNLRIEKAKALLIESPGMPLSQVAEECGFNDYNYFITVFKKITGTTPKKYI